MHDNGIEELITKLYDMVQDARSLPLGADKCIVERDKVLDMLDEISNQLPGELKQAKTIVDSRNELIAKAKREAEGLYRAFGKAARTLPEGWRLVVLSSHTEFERAFGRSAEKKRKLYNGMLKCDAFFYHGGAKTEPDKG